MKKIYRHVKFYIKTSLKSIRRHIGMTLSAAMAVSITLILISMFMLIGDNLKTFTYHIEKQLTIRVSIDNVATQKEKEALMADIKKMDGVKKVTFSSGKKELEEYKKEYKDSNHLFDMYDGKSSPIRDALIVDMENANQIDAACKEISTKKNVISADYGGDHTDEMISVFASIAMTGIKLITSQPMSYRNTSIVGLSVALGVGVTQASASLGMFPAWVTTVFGKTPVVIATVTAVFLNLVLPKNKPAEKK